MKKLAVVPEGWPCTIEECRPGHFVYQKQLCFKTEYRSDKDIEVYCDSGETFCPRMIEVQPVKYLWEEED